MNHFINGNAAPSQPQPTGAQASGGGGDFKVQTPSRLFNIRISAAQNGRAVELLAYEWKTLVDNCSFFIADPKNQSQNKNGNTHGQFQLRPAVQTFYEEPVVETDETVEPDANFTSNSLTDLALTLVKQWCSEMGHGLQDQPRLEILNMDAWCLQCVQIHYNIQLNGFSLGNFVNFGTFIQHYRLDMNERIKTSTNLLEKGEMDLHLEHDCRKLNIRFTLGEFNAQRKRLEWHLYKMMLDYAGIHSVIVDFSENNCIALYLRLKYVPKIVVDEPRPKSNVDSSKTRFIREYGKRSHNFYRVSNVQNWGKRLGRSAVIRLNYPVNGKDEERIHCYNYFWEVLSRLKSRAKIRVYFLAVRTMDSTQEPDENMVSHDLFTSFPCYYLVRALFSRGYSVLDQMDPKFITKVAEAARHNPTATEKALEQLLAAVDEHRYMSLLIAFTKLFTHYAMSSSDIAAQLLEDEQIEVPRNCVKVRKLIVTPTRELLMPPEVMMCNRVLRKFGPDFALRVLFRDEDGTKIRADRMQENLFRKMVSDLLMEGRHYGRRHYRFLAWSNSQLRDHGCYMYCSTDNNQTVVDIRRWMGDFTASSNVPKYMSRMGQCFTQAQPAVKIPLSPDCTLVKYEEDVKTGAVDQNGEPYLFSDGIGRISQTLAKKIAEQLELEQPCPSAYQIRYAGCKGMLSVDIRLDKSPNGPQLILRNSMKKFESDSSPDLEIVKHSQPSPVYLNRPLVMILDQVSRKQGAACGEKVSNEIHKLLEKELFSMADMLLSEKASREALVNRLNLKINFKRLQSSGFGLTQETFFRSLLLAVHKYTIKAQLFKAKVEIPIDQGRTMYGVLDETNVLQYGQVFIQYSENLKKPGENIKRITGKVMVTKNPCLVPGDVRIFNAVYKEALKHLVDVIVFPRNGPRPHTDEMAGSDLDGDEYAVYWNLNLMFNKNEEAMHFPKSKPSTLSEGVKDQHMVDFFITYISQDSIGKVANAHLVQADLLPMGIYDPICMGIARKCSAAVDFPKTGVPAEPLTDEEMPPRYPDYMQKEHKPMYRSRKLLGQLYRKIKMVADTVELGQHATSQHTLYDPDLEVDGWEEYKLKATEVRDRYSYHLQALLDQYGVQDEAQLVSGHMVSIRNRISDGEREDFSFYNTEKIVELRIHKIFEKFRRDFFDDFGGEREDLLQSPTQTVQQKASAYYIVTYGGPEHGNQIRMLSFPWLVWEILAYIKMHRVFRSGIDDELMEPVHAKLTKAIDHFYSQPQCKTDRNRLLSLALQNAQVLKFPLLAYGEELGKALYIILRWCEKETVYRPRALRIEHVALLFIQFASGQSGFVDEMGETWEYIKPIEELKHLHDTEPGGFGNSRQLYRIGSLIIDFIKYLSSQYFRCQKVLDFQKFGIDSTFHRREWLYLHSIALKTYHHIAWTCSFKSLHLEDCNLNKIPTLKWDRDELDPIPIQISIDGPLTVQRLLHNTHSGLIHCSALLKQWSGMDEVNMRWDSGSRDPNQYLVVGAGSLEARNKLKEILLADNLEEALYNEQCPENLREEE